MNNIFNGGKPLTMQEKNKRAILMTLESMEGKILEVQQRMAEINAFLATVVSRVEAVEAFHNQQRVRQFGNGPSVGV